jgi:hypothetical protein
MRDITFSMCILNFMAPPILSIYYFYLKIKPEISMLDPKFASIYLKIQAQLRNEAPKLVDKDIEFKQKAESLAAQIKDRLSKKYVNFDEIFNKALRIKRYEECNSWLNKWLVLQEIEADITNRKTPVWLQMARKEPLSRSDIQKNTKDAREKIYQDRGWDISQVNQPLPDSVLREAFAVTDFDSAEAWGREHLRTFGSLQRILQATQLAEQGLTVDSHAVQEYDASRFQRYTAIAASEGWEPKRQHFTKVLANINPQINEWMKSSPHYDKNTF